MNPDDDAVARVVKSIIEPPMRITGEFAGALLKLIVEQGTQRQKAEALEIAQNYMTRIGEWS